MSGWQPLQNQPPFNADTMLLLTDGSVMCHEYLSSNWHRLVPYSTGSYLQGLWIATAPMPPDASIPQSQNGPNYQPLYFASAVLQDGRLFVAGGEYNVEGGASGQVDVSAAYLYDPVSNQWTNIDPPASLNLQTIGDAPCCVLADGRVLIGNSTAFNRATALFKPSNASWTVAGKNGIKQNNPSEETWTLMPDGTVVTVNTTIFANSVSSEKYVPSSDSWVGAGTLQVPIVQWCKGQIDEIGPAVLLPDGRLFAVGANGNTALYTPSTSPSQPGGGWVNGPQLVNNSGNTVYPIDAPACLLPSGNVLCCGGGSPPCNYPPPTMFFEYQPLTGAIGSLSQVPSPDSAGSTACYQYRVLLLPNGQVIVSNGSNQLEVYTPEGQPEPEWAPAITSLPQAIRQGISEKVVGTQLNGLSQACSYGDDATMATNYPLVRINFSTGIVAYARTANHSTMAVATGTAPQYTYFTVPAGVVDPRTAGLANVSVVANGIMSNPVQATILYSVRTNLINDESFQNDPIPLNGKGLSSLVNPDYAPLQSGSPISVRMLMYLVDAYNAKLPWWRPSAGGFPA